MKTFTLTDEQEAKYEAWRLEKKGKLPNAAIGGAYTFCFTPSGIGPFIKVKCADGDTLDLTDDGYEEYLKTKNKQKDNNII